MPRPNLPPTPASSADIQAKENGGTLSLQTAFTLPPPAIASTTSSSSSSASVKSESSYHPVSPTSPTASRKRGRSTSSQTQGMAADFRLPPPPTRSRRIIQMKPGTSASKPTSASTNASPTAADKTKETVTNKTQTKKQPSATSGAGKKMARKTAHSIIERRRRSKMNEEFGVLKNMIPACSGHEMHKLAILQAGIDYVRYLEQCITDLKANNNHHSMHPAPADTTSAQSNPTGANDANSNDGSDSESDQDEDTNMMSPSASTTTSPNLISVNSHESLHSYTSGIPSPALPPSYHQYTSSYASTTTSLASPGFGPQNQSQSHHHGFQNRRLSYAHSTEVSPMILPRIMHEADHEATSALLMLNHDRRHAMGDGSAGRGISVKDLITS